MNCGRSSKSMTRIHTQKMNPAEHHTAIALATREEAAPHLRCGLTDKFNALQIPSLEQLCEAMAPRLEQSSAFTGAREAQCARLENFRTPPALLSPRALGVLGFDYVPSSFKHKVCLVVYLLGLCATSKILRNALRTVR